MLAQPFETITVRSTKVACDGGGGPSGHPRVFLHLEDGKIVCPYCSRLFVLALDSAQPAGH